MTVKKINKYISDASKIVNSINNHSDEILKISKLLINANKNNKMIYVCGNGGSDSEAEHFVTELLCTYDKKNRKPISAVSLNSSASSISAWSNDFEYETFLKRSVQAHCKKNDILFILTTSGGSRHSKQSLNVVNAAREAQKKNVKVIVLTGKKGGQVLKYSDLSIHIKSNKTSHIQESQLIILHLICEFLEN